MASSTALNRREFLKNSMLMGAAGMMSPSLFSFVDERRARAQDRRLRAAICTAGLAGSWNLQGQEAANRWGELLGVDITWFDGEFDVTTQRTRVEEMAQESWDFVAMQPNAIGLLVEPVQAMIDAGIPVIDLDTLIAPLEQTRAMGVVTFIAPNNVFMAESVVSKLIEKMGGAGKIARIGGAPGHTGAQARGRGFYNIVQRSPEVIVVNDQPGEWLVERAAELTRAVLARHPDLKAIFADNDDMALAARQVVEDEGLGDQLFVGGVDGMSSAIQAVAEGRLVATARNSTTRIHGWGVIAGAYAATVGLEQARQDIPFFILADGPAIYADIDSDLALTNSPWMLNNYGLSATAGMIWAQEQLLF